MLSKIIGASFLVLSASMYANKMITEEKKRIDLIAVYIETIRYVKSQIDLYSMPLDKILKGINENYLEKLGRTSYVNSFCELFAVGDGQVGEEAMKILREFLSTLGKGYREMQIKLCDKAILGLEEEKNKMQNAFPSKKKTILALCIGVGGMALIALI